MVSYSVAMFTNNGSVSGLNPYCSGRWSRTFLKGDFHLDFPGLNPYCSGRWSRTRLNVAVCTDEPRVLILIVVDDGLVLIHYKINNLK